MKVLFLLPSLTSAAARQILHLELLRESGIEVRMLAFTRGSDRYAFHPALAVGLGNIRDGNYLRRIPIYIKSMMQIRREARSSDCIIAYGVDLTALAWLSTLGLAVNRALILGLLDVRNEILRQSGLGNVLRIMQKFVISRIGLLVVSSPQFVTDYLERHENIKVGKWICIENKVDTRNICINYNAARKVDLNAEITVGYFGVLRCQRSFDILLETVKRANGKVKLYIRGIFSDVHFEEKEISDNKNIIYGGEYKNPEDLAYIYNCCDVVWSCYPYSEEEVGNWRWARTNRFYEACVFQRPPIVNKGTQDGCSVESFDIGLSLDLRFPDQCIEQLLNLDGNSIRRYSDNIARLPKKFAAYTDDFTQLRLQLEKVIQ